MKITRTRPEESGVSHQKERVTFSELFVAMVWPDYGWLAGLMLIIYWNSWRTNNFLWRSQTKRKKTKRKKKNRRKKWKERKEVNVERRRSCGNASSTTPSTSVPVFRWTIVSDSVGNCKRGHIFSTTTGSSSSSSTLWGNKNDSSSSTTNPKKFLFLVPPRVRFTHRRPKRYHRRLPHTHILHSL